MFNMYYIICSTICVYQYASCSMNDVHLHSIIGALLDSAIDRICKLYNRSIIHLEIDEQFYSISYSQCISTLYDHFFFWSLDAFLV